MIGTWMILSFLVLGSNSDDIDEQSRAIISLALYKPNFPAHETTLTKRYKAGPPINCNVTDDASFDSLLCSLNDTFTVKNYTELIVNIYNDVIKLSRLEPTDIIHKAWHYQVYPNPKLFKHINEHFKKKDIDFDDGPAQILLEGNECTETSHYGSLILRYIIEELIDFCIIQRPHFGSRTVSFDIVREETISSSYLIPSLHITFGVILSTIIGFLLFVFKKIDNYNEKVMIG